MYILAVFELYNINTYLVCEQPQIKMYTNTDIYINTHHIGYFYTSATNVKWHTLTWS